MDAPASAEQTKLLVNHVMALARQIFALETDPDADLPVGQLRVCSILQSGARPMSSIGRGLGVSLSAMTQIADRLERARLVKRVAENGDRRVRCLQLTPRGEKIMRLREEKRLERASALLQYFAPQARTEVLAALETLSRACEAMQEQSQPAESATGERPEADVSAVGSR